MIYGVKGSREIKQTEAGDLDRERGKGRVGYRALGRPPALLPPTGFCLKYHPVHRYYFTKKRVVLVVLVDIGNSLLRLKILTLLRVDSTHIDITNIICEFRAQLQGTGSHSEVSSYERSVK